MSESKPAPRRERVERNIYRRVSGVYEIGFKDASGSSGGERLTEGSPRPVRSATSSWRSAHAESA